MLIKQIKENGHSINTFQYNEDVALGLFKGLDDVTEDIVKAMQCSKEIFQDYLCDHNHTTKFMAILEKLASIDSGLTYNFCVDKSNKITGFVWMTSVIRSNIYRFGSFISVDFIKKKNKCTFMAMYWSCCHE